jgi:uncharacterized protein (DUF2384 family)
MNNIDEFRSADFGKYLLETKLVVAGKEKLMVHWTRKFFEYRLRHLNWVVQLSPDKGISKRKRIGKRDRHRRKFSKSEASSRQSERGAFAHHFLNVKKTRPDLQMTGPCA